MTDVRIKDHFDHNKEVVVMQSVIDRQSKDWAEIMEKAERAGLISMSAGGLAVLMHPHVQIEEGHYHRIQVATGNRNRCVAAEKWDKAE